MTPNEYSVRAELAWLVSPQTGRGRHVNKHDVFVDDDTTVVWGLETSVYRASIRRTVRIPLGGSMTFKELVDLFI